MKAIDPPIIVQQSFNVSRKVVWEAITQLNQMTEWFFEDIPNFEAKTGFYTEFNVSNGERDFLHQWKIIEVVSLKKITYNWSYKEYPGIGHVTFELNESDQATTLTLTNTVLEDFPEDIPEFKRESCIGGWNYFIKERLAAFLNG